MDSVMTVPASSYPRATMKHWNVRLRARIVGEFFRKLIRGFFLRFSRIQGSSPTSVTAQFLLFQDRLERHRPVHFFAANLVRCWQPLVRCCWSLPIPAKSKLIWLVVGPPLWKIWKSIGMIIPNIWENKTCSKPPTSNISPCLKTCIQMCWFVWGGPNELSFRAPHSKQMDLPSKENIA